MSGKSTKYACEAAAACGFAVMDHYVAMTLRPDLWGSAQDCRLNFTADIALPGATPVRVTLEGINRSVLVLTRSTKRLAERIEWVTGRAAVIVGDYEPAPKPIPAEDPLAAENRRRRDEKLAKQRALAAEEAPSHDCSHRHEILAARAELAKHDQTANA